MSNKEYKYKFTIIMAVYNVEKYLEEAILSIVKQTIGFDNIELILVNDGSKDNSEKICLEYVKKYPNNIVYKKKKNGGPASARNIGLKLKKGQYLNFLDSDDLFTPNVLDSVYNFLEENKSTIDLVTIPLYFFGDQTGLHPKYKYFEEKNYIVDLEKEPYNFILSSSATFYKTELFETTRYDERMISEEDTKLNFMFFKKNKQFGYVCEDNVMYQYRKRNDQTSITDNSKVNTKSYYSVVYLLNDLLKGYRKLPDYMKELIIYELRSRLKNFKAELFKKEADYLQVLKRYQQYVTRIDREHIAFRSKWIDTKAMKYVFLSNIYAIDNAFRYENGLIMFEKLKLFAIGKVEICIRIIHFENNKMKMEITYPNYYIDDVTLVLQNKKKKNIKPISKLIVSSAYDVKYGENVIFKTVKAVFEITISENKLTFKFLDGLTKETYDIASVVYNNKSPFVLKDGRFKRFLPSHTVSVSKSDIIIKSRTDQSIKHRFLSSIRYGIRTYKYIKDKYNFKAFYRIFNMRHKKYILISDRPEKGCDNGEAFFKYINQNHKDVAKYTYFAISKKSSEYNRLKKIGNVVATRSMKHKFLYLNAKYVFSSHLAQNFFMPFEPTEKDYYMDLIDYKFIWLQHGITITDISRVAHKYKENIDYMVTATKKEYEEFNRDSYLYDKGDVLLTGFPRFDALNDDSKDVITIIPTWRSYLSGKIMNNGFHETISDFEKSEYYLNYAKLLDSKRVQKMLRKHNYTLRFILHPGMNGYYDSFKKLETSEVRIISVEEATYSKVFAESKLLITDYSSVFFDFAYLKKPLIYFQFDQQQFFGLHYKKGHFSYEDDGFGDVIPDASKVIDKIEYYFENKFKMEKKYMTRVENTFYHKDKNNCERLYNEVINKEE